MKINVERDRQRSRLYRSGCSNFGRLHYISTCYVSGRHPGNFTENDLVVGQRFNNYYEETKYLAEVEVQNRMKRGLAATIYRPAIVVGDSQTGATQKFDGPYGALRWLLRCPRIAPMVTRRRPAAIPRQSGPAGFCRGRDQPAECADVSGGRVYQLCDPHPSTRGRAVRYFRQADGAAARAVPSAERCGSGPRSNTSRASDSGRGSHPSRSITSPIRPNTPARTRCGT